MRVESGAHVPGIHRDEREVRTMVSDEPFGAAVRKALGVAPGAPSYEVLQQLREVEELRGRRAKKALAMVDRAIEAHLLWPAQRDWAEDYAVKDPEGFVTYIEQAPVVTPTAAEQINDLARQRQRGGLGYREALEAIALEQPELVRRYDAERRRDDRMAVQFARTKGK